MSGVGGQGSPATVRMDAPSLVLYHFEMTDADQPLSQNERLRRVVIVCAAFGRNYAIYRAGQNADVKQLLTAQHRDQSFWLQINSNCLDIAVLEWCKLFGEKERGEAGHGQHGWRRIASDPAGFKRGLLEALGTTDAEFAELIEAMRKLRDKFIAHLDSDRTMNIPLLTAAYSAVAYYHRHVVTIERGSSNDWLGPPHTPEQYALGYQALYNATLEMMKQANS